jgi:hypothetical protein
MSVAAYEDLKKDLIELKAQVAELKEIIKKLKLKE